MSEALFKTLQQAFEQNVMDIDTLKKEGRKAIGCYCLYSPVELIVAADAIPLPLCGTKNDPVSAAEEILPRNLCPLIKSSYGFAALDTCPFFRFSDMIVADTTCDGKKKMFELMQQYKEVHVLQLPQNQNTAISLEPWRKEVEGMKDRIEAVTGVTLTTEKINRAIDLLNRERDAKKAVMDLAQLKPSPIKGSEILTVLFKVGFLADKEKGIKLMNTIVNHFSEINDNKQSPYTDKTPRVLISGVPMGIGSDKVARILEEAGASVVGYENCTGYKQVFTVPQNDDPIDVLSRQYLSIPCSVMSPNQGRLDLLDDMINHFKVDGVVDLTWQACHTYNVESFSVEKWLNETKGLPMLHLETDYSDSDTEQLRVRIEAFLEML
ncbi:MAG: 2-hydroxyacyl-CoA dehydratase family protein [Proteobacteria bacterium]|nr:2-hydroxyacyl-CoA dehydratase family protein [Pseudomonadota bacterium]